MNNSGVLAGCEAFLDEFFQAFNQLGVDATPFYIDHIAYQASSSEDYERLLPEFEEIGEMVSEAVVGGRRVGIYQLTKPLEYQGISIPAIELIEPKSGQVCPSAFEHVELVIDTSLDAFAQRYATIPWDLAAMHRDKFPKVQIKLPNGLGVKFHTTPVLEEVKAR